MLVQTNCVFDQDKGSLASLNIANNKIFFQVNDAGAMPALAEALKKTTKLTSLDISNNYMKAVQVEILAPALQDMGSLSSVNLLKNGIGVDQASALVKIKESKPNLKTLCGFTLEETELDMSKQGLKAEDAVLLASDIQDMGSLSKLIFSGDSPRSKPVTVEVGMTEADFSGAVLQQSGAIILTAWLKHKVQHDSDYNQCWFGLIAFSIRTRARCSS
jgi:hypothetical protein